jgi:hypothetical protein
MVRLWACIRDMLGSNLSLDTDYHDWGFCGFPQFLQANVELVHLLHHGASLRILSNSSFVTHLTTRRYVTRSWQCRKLTQEKMSLKSLSILTSNLRLGLCRCYQHSSRGSGRLWHRQRFSNLVITGMQHVEFIVSCLLGEQCLVPLCPNPALTSAWDCHVRTGGKL